MIMKMITENDNDDDDDDMMFVFTLWLNKKKESLGMGYFRVIIESCNKAKW